jgi:hypothetical protein
LQRIQQFLAPLVSNLAGPLQLGRDGVLFDLNTDGSAERLPSTL